MKPADIYLYGQVLMTTSLLLHGDFPELDTYGELKAKYHLTGGETGTCATVLDALGCTMRAEGCWLGRDTRKPILDFYADKNVDLSLMTYDPEFEGLEDFVVIAGGTRTCLGRFGAFFDAPVHRWNQPDESHIAGCKVAGIDPFFPGTSDDVARLCVGLGVPYVTIDCKHDTYLHRHAAVNAVSNEFLSGAYAGERREDVFAAYQREAEGLTLFTLGAREVLYGRRGEAPKTFTPYNVEVESTLGAGDVFKAGCVYALYKGMSDDETVSFASACSAAAIMKFPIPLNPPTLERIEAIRAGRK